MNAPPRVIEILRAYTLISYASKTTLLHNLNVCIGHLRCCFLLENLWLWHHDANYPSQTPMQTKHIWDCHKQSQAPVISSFMSFQWLHRHELLRRAVTKEFRVVSVWNCARPQICSLSFWKRNIARHTCACFSKHCKSIFYKQGWSWSWGWGEVTCTASLEWELQCVISSIWAILTQHINLGKTAWGTWWRVYVWSSLKGCSTFRALYCHSCNFALRWGKARSPGRGPLSSGIAVIVQLSTQIPEKFNSMEHGSDIRLTFKHLFKLLAPWCIL